jgi:hypothetical protein
LGAVTSLASSTSQMSTFFGLWTFSSLPSFIIQIVELMCDTVSVLQSLKCISNCWVDVYTVLVLQSLKCISIVRCGTSVVQRSNVLLKKLCSKQTLLLCTISKLLLRRGLLAYTVVCSNAGRRWHLWHLAQALYQINYSLLDLLHG